MAREVHDSRKLKTSNIQTSSQTIDFEFFYSEIIDREKRSKNIIIYGVDENDKLLNDQRQTADKEAVISVLSTISDSDFDNVSVTRLGKIEKNKTKKSSSTTPEIQVRLIKVTQQHPFLIISILQNKRKYTGSCRIGPDRRLMQRTHMKTLKQQPKSEEDSGNKNAKIHYVNGVSHLFKNLSWSSVSAPSVKKTIPTLKSGSSVSASAQAISKHNLCLLPKYTWSPDKTL